jgi:hypothetical protein
MFAEIFNERAHCASFASTCVDFFLVTPLFEGFVYANENDSCLYCILVFNRIK